MEYSAKAAHDFWKNHNQCNSQNEINIPDFNGDGEYTTRLISYDCEDNKSVELYSLEGEGHTWWKKSWGHDINASELNAVFSKPIMIHQKHIQDYLSKVDNTLKSIIENNTIPKISKVQ